MKFPNVSNMYSEMGKGAPQVQRGQVWCYECGQTQKVDSAKCLSSGWPKCCGYTMSIDSPKERAALKGEK